MERNSWHVLYAWVWAEPVECEELNIGWCYLRVCQQGPHCGCCMALAPATEMSSWGQRSDAKLALVPYCCVCACVLQ